MSYSLSFRKHVFLIKEKGGLSIAATSRRFGIGLRTLFRWKKELKPKKNRNKPATKINMQKLEKDIKKNPDSYLVECAERFNVSISGMFYAIRRLEISLKKNSISSQS